MKFYKKKDPFVFVRFGACKPVKQKGYGSDTFHGPPAKKGFYCFPKIAQEWYLLSSIYKSQKDNFIKNFGQKLLIKVL